jgi:hypothetical protein
MSFSGPRGRSCTCNDGREKPWASR